MLEIITQILYYRPLAVLEAMQSVVGFENALQELVHKRSRNLPSGDETRSSWLKCALRDDEAVYWVSIGHYKAVAVDN